MESSIEILIRRIIEELSILSKENKNILQKLYEAKVLDTEHAAEIKALEEKLKTVSKSLSSFKNQLESLEKTRTEIDGFAKYSKLLWAFVTGIIGYIISLNFHE